MKKRVVSILLVAAMAVSMVASRTGRRSAEYD